MGIKGDRDKLASDSTGVHADVVETLRWRCIGPYRGGRVVAVAADPADQMVFYFGACSGGVWKTEDGGTIWENVSDGFFNTAPVGAIAVSDSDPNVIYAGTGESCIRGNVSHGDGVYKSTDKGNTWRHIGLEGTRHIARVRVHPDDPDIVYVAALGHAFGHNPERGVYQSKNGGQTWELLLFKSEKAGAIDLSMDPGNPRVLYAAIWEALRRPWTFTSGGPDSGLYKSTDGGDTWSEITDNPGLPGGIKGRIGVAVSPARTNRVWASVEAEEGGLFRSDDGGASWERVSDDRNLQQRPWYYSHVFAHPQDPETVYVLNLKMWRSTDGGRTFAENPTPHGDNHDLWIDPRDPQRMVEGNDGGACVSFNGGEAWSSIYNQPTAQFYRMATDGQFPYRVYATQQDNTAISVPSRSAKAAILWSDCYIAGTSESGQIAVRQDDPNIVYSGAIGSTSGGGESLLRYDHRNGQVRTISVWPELYWEAVKGHKYRFQWTYPIVISPHDPDVLYVAANVVFRSDNEGHSWQAVSPDLTRGDVTKMEDSGGPITLDMTYVEHYGTVFALAESPREQGLLWAGTDDGLVHISRDRGKTWDDVTPKEIPEWTLISMIELSRHDPATAYVAATRYKLHDMRPYIYKTSDYGRTWAKITNGIPEHDFTRVVREDPERQGLLYAGTETGAYVSLDDGASWQPLKSSRSADSGHTLPAAPVHDMAVKENELVAATHGRSFWVLDDLALLRQLPADVSGAPAHLFKPGSVYRVTPATGFGKPAQVPGRQYSQAAGAPAVFRQSRTPDGETVRRFLNAGTNPPEGVIVTYYIGQKPDSGLTLTFLDSKGRTARSVSSRPKDGPPADAPMEPHPPAEPGMNRFVWDLRYDGPREAEGADPEADKAPGPVVTPGDYQVRMTVGDQTHTETFQVLADPRATATQADLDEQLDLLLRIRDKLSEAREAVDRIRSARRQIEEWVARAEGTTAHDAVSEAAESVKAKLSAAEDELKIRPEFDTRVPARVDSKLLALGNVVSTGDYAPTRQSHDAFEVLAARADAQLRKVQEAFDTDLYAFVNLVHKLKVPAIVAKSEQ